MMSPEQYDANVKTKKSGTEFVEFFGGELAEFADPAGRAGVFGP